jgi:hypothetical protein
MLYVFADLGRFSLHFPYEGKIDGRWWREFLLYIVYYQSINILLPDGQQWLL